jgi:hypothetical protein
MNADEITVAAKKRKIDICLTPAVREVGYGLSVEGASAAALVKSMQAAAK